MDLKKIGFVNGLFLALALMLALATALPSNGSMLVYGEHQHQMASPPASHAHAAKTGYKIGCDDRSSLHCGAKIAIGDIGFPSFFVALGSTFIQQKLPVLMARDIAQEIPPPRL